MYPHILTLRSDSQLKIAAKFRNLNNSFCCGNIFDILSLQARSGPMPLGFKNCWCFLGQMENRLLWTVVQFRESRTKASTSSLIASLTVYRLLWASLNFLHFWTISKFFSKLNWAGRDKSNIDLLKIIYPKN